ncbi:hypothetical protein WN55_10547 [Dufourea novaeangliae]|uniref:Uncharacterized protein n=1 Tax=Dufourea novaeangliae TaxID=178035 RepID=A0A154P3Z2_DUFNO|nr:hypothetical protein WN55_10547 [Dufourea novaeangliae]
MANVYESDDWYVCNSRGASITLERKAKRICENKQDETQWRTKKKKKKKTNKRRMDGCPESTPDKDPTSR